MRRVVAAAGAEGSAVEQVNMRNAARNHESSKVVCRCTVCNCSCWLCNPLTRISDAVVSIKDMVPPTEVKEAGLDTRRCALRNCTSKGGVPNSIELNAVFCCSHYTYENHLSSSATFMAAAEAGRTERLRRSAQGNACKPGRSAGQSSVRLLCDHRTWCGALHWCSTLPLTPCGIVWNRVKWVQRLTLHFTLN